MSSGFGRAAAVAAAFLFALPAFTQPAGPVEMLDRLEPGLWEWRSASGSSLGRICLGDPLLLAQLQHRRGACTRELIESHGRSATVQYSCRGAGVGRTTLRLETRRLVQVDSQGLDGGAPFAVRAQARRIGPCTAPTAPERRPTGR